MDNRNVKTGACLLAADSERRVTYYRDILGLDTAWKTGDLFADFHTGSGPLSFFMYDRKAFADAVNESYYPPEGINLTMEIGLWLPKFSDFDKE